MAEAIPRIVSLLAMGREWLATPVARRWGKRLLITLSTVAVLGFLVVPPLVRPLLVKVLAGQLHREVRIERVAVNPFRLSATLEGLSVRAAEGHEILGFDELTVNLSASSLPLRAVVVDMLRLTGLRIDIARVDEGRYDISDLVDQWTAPSPEPSPGVPRFSLNNIELAGGRIVFRDLPKGQEQVVDQLHLGIPFLSSLPYQADIQVEPHFSARLNGAPLVVDGHSRPFANGRESELRLDLERFDLAQLQPYLPSTLPLAIATGLLDTDLGLVFRQAAGGEPLLRLSGRLRLADLALTERDGTPLVGWQALEIGIRQLDPLVPALVLEQVALDGLDLSLTVNPAGEFNLLRLIDRLRGPGATAPAAPAAGDGPAWAVEGIDIRDGRIRWQDRSNRTPVAGEVRGLHVRAGRIDHRLSAPLEIIEAGYQVDLGERLRVGQSAVRSMKIDLPAHRIDIEDALQKDMQGIIVRHPDGKVEWVAPPVFKTVGAARDKTGDDKPWQVHLKALHVDNFSFQVEDRTLKPAAVQALSGLQLRAENLSNAPGVKGNLQLDTRVNKTGKFAARGEVQASPPAAALQIDAVGIPVLPLQPYFEQHLNIALKSGQITHHGELQINLDQGKPRGGYRGSLTLGDFQAVEKGGAGGRAGELLKWRSFHVDGIDLQLDTPSLRIGEVALSDFTARLVLNPQGRLNLADMIRRPPLAEAAIAEAGPGKEPVAVGKAAPGHASTTLPPAAAPALPIDIARVTLQNGNVSFADYFVKPSYAVTVSRLGGRVSGLSTRDGTLADMELKARYARSAPVEIKARLNPLSPNPFLDLKAVIQGVDLVDFSPYAGKYAGYKIEKGKLSLDLAYKLDNRQLTADNRVFIDQFTFGDAVDSPDATSLPVSLAIALLKNNRGEIDINLPIAGTLDDPEFSVGGLIVKVIANLFVKAAASPFALLGSMFGGGEDLSAVDFIPGSAEADERGRQRLEALARALIERQSLKLEITGLADRALDREGLRRMAIERGMLAEKQKATGSKEAGGQIEPAEYKTYLTRVYRAASFPKPRNAIGLQKDLPVEDMERLLLTHLPASDADIAELARQRGENIQVWLIEQGKVPPERVFLLPPKVGEDQATRAEFSLK